jgi:ribonuclease-3 family protein
VEEKMKGINAEQLSPAAWAYIGDAYYELIMRLMTLEGGPRRMSEMHKQTASFVRAGFQAKASVEVEEHLTDEEKDILRRGRNVKSGHVPKSASPVEYRLSTGLEGLIGYLYLTDREDRAREILGILRECKGETK